VSGAFDGRFSLPFTVLVQGDYIQRIIQFNVGVEIDMGGYATGTIDIDPSERLLTGELTFGSTGMTLPLPDTGWTFSFEISTGTDSINGFVAYMYDSIGKKGYVSFFVDSSAPLVDVLQAFLENGGSFSFRVNGGEPTKISLTAEDMELLADSAAQYIKIIIESMIGLAGSAGVTI
jgi:hypothetical protein